MSPRLILRVFTGPMWSGKTSALIQAAKVHGAHGFTAPVGVKHAIDTRSAPGQIQSRDGHALPAAHSVADLAHVQPNPGHLYAVDEAQFFGDSLVEFWGALAARHCEAAAKSRTAPPTALLVAGLDLDFQAKEFGAVMRLCRAVLGGSRAVDFHMARLTARCTHVGGDGHPCGQPACYSQRLAEGGDGQVRVGGDSYYQPACPSHHVPTPIPIHVWDAGLAAKRAAQAVTTPTSASPAPANEAKR